MSSHLTGRGSIAVIRAGIEPVHLEVDATSPVVGMAQDGFEVR
jgi:hypothetical protein